MLKKNWLKILISSIITLSPIAFGLAVWNKLPETMATHWGISGDADGFSSRPFAVFGLPTILLLLNLLIIIVSSLDKKNRNQNTKAYNIIYLIAPITSIFANAIIYAAAFEKIWDFTALFPLLIGILFATMGNITPKIRQNSTLGIKLKWTLQSEENWNATHRFGGKVMFFAGILILLTAFLPFVPMMISTLAIVFATLIITAIYSYNFYKKELASNTEFKPIYSEKSNKIGITITLITVPLILIGTTILMFTGDVTVTYTDDSFTVDSVYYEPLTLKYDEIDNIEIKENVKVGPKEFGFDSIKLSLGKFRNDEFGSHTRYTYNNCKTIIVIESDGKTLVINDKDDDVTREIYLKIKSEMSE